MLVNTQDKWHSLPAFIWWAIEKPSVMDNAHTEQIAYHERLKSEYHDPEDYKKFINFLVFYHFGGFQISFW